MTKVLLTSSERWTEPLRSLDERVVKRWQGFR